MSTETAKILMETKPVSAGASLLWAQFRSPTELVIVSLDVTVPGKPVFNVMVVDTINQETRTFAFPEFIIVQTLNMSLGGRYLIAENVLVPPVPHLVAIDLQSGTLAGRANARETFYESIETLSTAFSHDGKQLAVLQRLGENVLQIVTINVSSGIRNKPVRIPGDAPNLFKGRLHAKGGRRFSWLTDNRHLVLFDTLIVDSTTGNISSDNRLQFGSAPHHLGDMLIWTANSSDGVFIQSKKLDQPNTSDNTP